MSYPPQIHDGDRGEVSAVLRPGDSTPEIVYPNGNRVHCLSTGASTGGLFGLYRWEFAGPRSGPDAHFHKTMTESFYTLSGKVTIFDGRTWVTTHPGDYVHVPAGGLHGFKNETGEPASMLLHFAPGAPREAYFEGLARGLGTMTPEERAEFMVEHDNYWTT